MREERRLTSWLADYRDSLDEMETPVRVETRLLAEVRRQRRVSVAPWLLAAGAAAVLVLGIWIGRTRPETAVITPSVLPPQVVRQVEPIVTEPAATLPVIPPRTAPAPAHVNQQPAAIFVMLPGTELMPPTRDVQVLRVRIPRTRIQALGWPVNVDRLEESVLADVAVGEDGIPRAVRLVEVSQ